ncbi:pyruvate oxidase [Priestia filamentosa]|uniref:pyruvate oxidase n=1 Tax=Priestia filamentosa TaxID=1402861 RepID=UPI0002F8E3C2|nr:pyruvate oxidase [Priestia filamentosa]
MAKTTAGQALIRSLQEWNIDHIYGLPGDSINNVMEELRKAKEQIKFIGVRHEEAASLAASSYAKITGKIGVCLSIAGPGAVHLLNGMYDAASDSVPMLVLAGQVSTEKLGRDDFQEINLQRMFDDVAVFNKTVQRADTLPDLLNQAIKTAYAKKGVAVLTIPDDIPVQEIDESLMYTSSVFREAQIVPNGEDLKKAVTYLNEAKRPVILAGKGALHARKEVEAFSERFGAPVVVTLPGKGVIPDEHPSNLGNLGQIGTKPAYEAMEETDLLIMIGTSFPYRDYLPEKAKAIQIDMEPTQIGKRYPVSVGIVGDAKEVLPWLTAHGAFQEDRHFLEKCQENMENWWRHIGKDEQKEETPITAHQVIPQLQKIVEDDAILSVDVGNVTVWMARHFRITNQQFIISSWLATMGCGLPGAIAAKMAYPERQAVAVCGDGGFSMVMQDFLTAVKYKLPIIVVVLNNEKIGMIKYEQEVGGHLDYAVDLQPFNFARFADVSGGIGYRVEEFEELAPAFEKAALATKPVILDIHIKEEPPLPGKIGYSQAFSYSKYLLKNFFKNHEVEMPPLKKSLKSFF